MVRSIAVGVALVLLSASSYISGQQPADQTVAGSPVAVMSGADAEAFAEAAANQLDYLPGEVVVKFKDGVERDAQQRALDVLRSRPAVDRLEWTGDVAILRDPLQPDAGVLAEQLSAQPEVAYAHPNYLRRKSL